MSKLNFVKTGRLLDSELKTVLKEVNQFKHKAYTASIYSDKDGPRVDPSVRSGKIYFTEPLESRNIFQILQSHIIENYLAFPFNFTNVSSVQYAYYKKNDHFKWHNDVLSIDDNNLYRTFTMSVNISSSDSYTGGEFLLDYQKKIIQLDKTPGSYIIFPAFLDHTVNQILFGTRESMVVWVQSPHQDLMYLKNLFTKYHPDYKSKNL